MRFMIMGGFVAATLVAPGLFGQDHESAPVEGEMASPAIQEVPVVDVELPAPEAKTPEQPAHPPASEKDLPIAEVELAAPDEREIPSVDVDLEAPEPSNTIPTIEIGERDNTIPSIDIDGGTRPPTRVPSARRDEGGILLDALKAIAQPPSGRTSFYRTLDQVSDAAEWMGRRYSAALDALNPGH